MRCGESAGVTKLDRRARNLDHSLVEHDDGDFGLDLRRIAERAAAILDSRNIAACGETAMQMISGEDRQFASSPKEVALAPLHAEERHSGDDTINFGRFRVVRHSRQLFLNGCPQEIGGRAFDLLMVLLRSYGSIVSKDEILNEVWPSMVVEECNLRFQIGSLRRALGPHGDMVKTVVRRGYMLVRDDHSSDANEFVDDQSQIVAPALAAANSTSSAPHIVLIEDDESVRYAIDSLLRSVGHAVSTYPSIDGYLESGTQCLPDCLILDVCLPGQSGLDFQAELVRNGIRYPIIFISGHADIPMSVRGMKAGAIEFLTKPVRHQELLSAVNLAIAERNRPSARRFYVEAMA